MMGACERREWERDREVFGLFFVGTFEWSFLRV